jgi:predicted nucleic acid-binding protein
MVAAMRVHGIANLLTLNAKDFRRFSGITILSPDDVLASFS